MNLSQLFEKEAQAKADQIALSFNEIQMSYEQLDKESNKLANYLISTHGVQRGDLIGLLLDRSEQMIIAIIGILKSGAAYVPIDTAYPELRKEAILYDSGLSILVTESNYMLSLSSYEGAIVALDIELPTMEIADTPPSLAIDETDLAYVLYTSGSTGTPKGCEITHGSLMNYINWAIDNYLEKGNAYSGHFPLFTSLSFDFTLTSIFIPLMSGNSIRIYHQAVEIDDVLTDIFSPETNVEVVKMTPSHILILENLDIKATNIKKIIVGGEELTKHHVAVLKAIDPKIIVVNEYGPTEATIGCIAAEVKADDQHITIGRAILGVSVYICDSSGAPSPKGVRGELYLGGVALARGYLNKPELTAEKFVIHKNTGERIYKTGDFGKWLPDGSIAYLGRKDDQIKIRGHRVELAEIEAKIYEFEGVTSCAVLVNRDNQVSAVLIAYFVANIEGLQEELKTFLQVRLPQHMLPTHFVQIEALPLTINGKINKQKLAAIGKDLMSDKSDYLAPRTEQEQQLAKIWEEVLLVDKVGVHDNFFALGGDSILSIKVIAKAQKQGIKITVNDIWECENIESLAKIHNKDVLDFKRQLPFSMITEKEKKLLTDFDFEVEDAYPLLSLQSGMIFHNELEVDNSTYHDVISLHLRFPFQLETFEQVVNELVATNNILRTSFYLLDERMLQVVQKAVDFKVEYTDISHLEEDAQEAFILKFVANEREEKFSLVTAPLLKIYIHQRGEDRVEYTMSFHHAIFDGWSTNTFNARLFTSYLSVIANNTFQLPTNSTGIEFNDYVYLEQQALKLSSNGEYWKKTLSGAAPTKLPRWERQTTDQNPDGRTVNTFSLELSSFLPQLRTISKTLNVPVKSILLSVHFRVLEFLIGRRKLISNVVMHGRPEVEGAENVLGLFLNSLPFVMNTELNESWSSFIQRIFGKEKELAEYKHYPLHAIQRETENNFSEILFNYTDFHVQENLSGFDELEVIRIKFYDETNFPLVVSFNAQRSQDYLSMLMMYDAKEFSSHQIEAISSYYKNAIELLCQVGTEEFYGNQLPLTTENQAFLTIAEQVSYPQKETIVSIFENRVKRAPSSIAIVDGGRQISYQELNERSNQLAHYLLEDSNIQIGDLVGVILNRSASQVIAILGILKVGGCYVPIDPTYPEQRIKYTLDDASVKLVISEKEVIEENQFITDLNTIRLTKSGNEFSNYKKINPIHQIVSADLAYIIYTSGSTGNPKGVMVEHGNVIQLLFNEAFQFDFNEKDVWTLFHSVVFDFSVWELFGALLYGGKLVMVSTDQSKDPRQFAQLLVKEGVTVLNQVPSTFNNLSAEFLQSNLDHELRYVIFGGEALNPANLTDWQAKYENTKLINMYGITETTVHVTYKEIGIQEINSGVSNIGKALPTLKVYIMDEDHRIMPEGTVGEIVVGGAGVSRGYLNMAELTATRFIDDPYSDQGRLYCSGDLGMLMSNGELVYKGRKDYQVKIRGYRIELGEIESTLIKHEQIKQAAVLDKVDKSGINQLIAYLIIEGKEEIVGLRAYLGAALPDYMIPSKFVNLKELPLTSNGKINREQLLSIEGEALNTGSQYVAPTSTLEKRLVTIWEDILETEPIGIHDNFFAIGGDSLHAVTLIARANAKLELSLEIRDLYTWQTINELAHQVALTSNDSKEDAFQIGQGKIDAIKEAILLDNDQAKKLPKGYEDFYPMTPIETGMIYSSLLRVEEPVYYDQFSFQLIVDDFSLLQKGIDQLVERHSILRTRYYMKSFKQPLKVVEKRIKTPLSLEDLSTSSESTQVDVIKRYFADDLSIRLTFDGELLWRMKAFMLSDKRCYIIWSFHHTMLDGWSIGVFNTELTKIMAGQTLSAMTHSYKDYCALTLGRQHSDKTANFWKDYLADYSKNKLPFNYSGVKIKEVGGMSTKGKFLGTDLLSNLERYEGVHQVSLKSICLAAHIYMLNILSTEQDVVTGMVAHDRPPIQDGDKMLGCFLNTVPIRVKMREIPSYLSLIQDVNRQIALLKSNELHLTDILRAIDEKTSHGNPIFDSLLNFTDFHVLKEGLNSEHLSVNNEITEGITNLSAEMTNTLFDMEVDKTHGNLFCRIKYTPAYFEEEQIAYALGLYERILNAIANDIEGKIDSASLLPDDEKSWLINDFNNTVCTYSDEATLHSIFEEQAAKTPDAIALRYHGEEVTYMALNERSNQLANLLCEEGVRIGDNVGLVADRGFEMIIGMYGILKAGAAYVPIDPDYPLERQYYILENSSANFVVVDKDFRKTKGQKILSVKISASESGYSGEDLKLKKSAKELAYTIYTSGSTGRPKGVMIAHHSAVNLIEWVNNQYKIGDQDRLLFVTPMCFDLSVYDIFGMLSAGGAVVIANREDIQDVQQLHKTLKEERITFWDSVPTTYNYLVSELLNSNTDYFQEDLRLVFMSGDWIPVSLPEQSKQFFPNAQIVSLGGATEGTVWSNYFEVDKVSDDWVSIPYGKPIANNFFYILDDQLNPTPRGVAGELYIGGIGVAEGYANDLIKTAHSFVNDPFRSDLGERMYKTGDLGRMLPDGYMEFLGRKDHQIKIRGFRVELGEIEHQLEKDHSIREAVVGVHKDGKGNNYLCAYMVAKGESIDWEIIKRHLSQQLPTYMIPAHHMLLTALPLTSNGKIDRKRLPEPDKNQEHTDHYQAPKNDLEQRLVEIWCEILGVEIMGINDNFLELGAHSLNIGSFVNRVNQELDITISLAEVFLHPTTQSLTDLIRDKNPGKKNKILSVTEGGLYKVSHAQKRLWVLDKFDESHIAYNITGGYTIEGQLEIDALKQAFMGLIERHESLRTVFSTKGDGLYQTIKSTEALGFELTYSDLSSEKNPREKAEILAQKEFSEPFDLNEGPLLRAMTLKIDDSKYIFLLVVHHIVSDGWSMNVMINDVLSLYSALRKGEAPSLEPLKIQYKDYAQWQKDLLDSEETIAHKTYWIDYLSGTLPILSLTTDFPRPAVKTYRGARLNRNLGKSSYDILKNIGTTKDASLFMVLVTTVNLLLNKYTNQKDIILGSPIAGRDNIDLENQIGFYVNMLPIRTKLSGNETFLELLETVKKGMLSSYQHQAYPFDMLVDDLDLAPDVSRSPIFDTVVVLQNRQVVKDTEALGEVSVSEYESTLEVSKYDLTFNFLEVGEDIVLSIEYNTDLFSEARIEKMLGHYQQLLQSIVINPDHSIAEISCLTSSEIATLCAHTIAPYPNEKTIVNLFESQVKKSPENEALKCGDTILSYQELNDRSNQIAHTLIEKHGVNQSDLVGVMMERSELQIVAILGVLKSGAAYVPIDPDYPEERIKYTLNDASIRVVLTEKEVTDKHSCLNTYESITLTRSGQELSGVNKANLSGKCHPKDLAYVIYTSGSTGTPKGVMVEHRNVVQLLFNDKFQFDFTSSDVWTLFHSIVFDFSVWEIFGSLLYGGKLVVVPGEISKDPSRFADLLIDEKVSILNQVPSMFTLLSKEMLSKEKPHELRYVIFGGEALNPSSLRNWYDRYSSTTTLVNMYGITETTVHVTYKEIGEKEIQEGFSNIGVPLSTVSTYIMDDQHRLMPSGTVGEIVVGGAGVSRGYLNREVLTSERFIDSPFNDGERLYCSGDLGLRRVNGELIYKGRKDAQVKIRGHRIELEEIEAVLMGHTAINEVAVIAIPDSDNNNSLVAYIVSSDKETVLGLRDYIGSKLPAYMIPTNFVKIDHIPLTINGKIDRKKLGDLEGDHIASGIEYEEPTTTIEKTLARIWESLLGIPKVGTRDNFFSLGGNSLLVIQMVNQVNEKFNSQLKVVDIFNFATVEDIANLLKGDTEYSDIIDETYEEFEL